MKKVVLLIVGLSDSDRRIARIAKRRGYVDDFRLVSENADDFAIAVKEIQDAGCDVIINKGLVESAVFMRLIFGYSEKALIKGGRDGFVSHCFILEKKKGWLNWLCRSKPLIITDGAVNIAPNKEQKAIIAQNAVDLARSLFGLKCPVLSILTAAGKIHPKIESSLDGEWLMSNGLVKNADARLDQFDTAISKKVRRLKKQGGGVADIMLVPDLDCGNPLFKAHTMRAGYLDAGLVLGCTVPVVLNSRADSPASKLLSIKYAKKMLELDK